MVFVGLLYHLAGVDMLPGLLFTLLTSLTGPLCGECSKSIKTKAAALTDLRLQLLYDTVEGMRVIKTQAWEPEMQVRALQVETH